MIMDKRSEFADGTSVALAIGSHLLGNVMDLEDLRDIGSASNIYLVVQVKTTVTSGGAGTLAVSLCSDAQAAIATNGTQTEHMKSATFALADLAAGDVLLQAVVPQEASGKTYERYLGIVATVAGAALTGGAIDAFLTTNPPLHRAYADGRR